MRIGTGYDVHKLVENRKLILGGVEIPYEKGLLGHSDADVLVHAIMDALLGAAALGDIGLHFPDNDPVYKNIADALDVDKDQVSVKATTEEHLGFTGRGEGISAQAVALITSPRDLIAREVGPGADPDAAAMPGGCSACPMRQQAGQSNEH